MWHYNGEDDASFCGRKGPDTPAALAKILAELYKGELEEFTRIKRRDGFSMYNPPSWVSSNPTTLLNLLPESLSMDINPFIRTGMAEDHQGAPQPRPTAKEPQPGARSWV